MSGAKKIRVESNERVDIDDFRFLANTVVEHRGEHLSEFACDPARGRKWVLSGFAQSNPAGAQVQVTRGKAILATKIAGAVQYGMLTTDGDATQTVDVSGYANGTYGIYVRFNYEGSDAESRVFWDPTGTGEEYIQTINTRESPGWSMRIEASTPGDEWLLIGEVTVAAGAISSLDEKRPMFFEGDEGATTAFESGWSSDGGGSANDRDSDRGAYGVSDLQMFGAAVRQCLEDIKGRGLRQWYSRDIGGMNLGFDAAPVEDRLALGDAAFFIGVFAGTQALQFDSQDMLLYDRGGNTLTVMIANNDICLIKPTGINPGADDALDLGSSSFAWQTLYLDTSILPKTDGAPAIGNWNYGTSTGLRFESIHVENIAMINDGAPQMRLIDLSATYDARCWAVEVVDDGAAGSNFYIRTYEDGYASGSTTPFKIEQSSSGSIDGITTLGDLNVEGDVIAGAGLVASGGGTGIAGTTMLTNAVGAASGANGSIGAAGGNANAGFLRFYLGTTAVYVPYWTAIT